MSAAIVAIVDPDTARRDAQHILSGRRYRSSPAPRPLHGVLQWIGDRFRGIYDWIGAHLGLPWGFELLLLGAFVAGVVLMVLRWGTRPRVRATTESGSTTTEPGGAEDADALERAADEAERAGDLDRAIRLRFRAGLLRLGTCGAIDYRPSITTGEVRHSLGSPRFDGLAVTFDEVTYGGRAADHPAADTARREWPHVLEESARR
jgi:hypothetical protein